MANELFDLTVYFDGACHLCSREIEHYRSIRGAEKIHFVDITSATFNAAAEKLDPWAIHKHLHARDAKGQLHVGVDAFIQIWSLLPALKFMSSFASLKPVHKALDFGYEIFARFRPYLPRKSCENSPYCETPKTGP